MMRMIFILAVRGLCRDICAPTRSQFLRTEHLATAAIYSCGSLQCGRLRGVRQGTLGSTAAQA
eukprot:14761678-Alexandrium_andersonii.AAC.1